MAPAKKTAAPRQRAQVDQTEETTPTPVQIGGNQAIRIDSSAVQEIKRVPLFYLDDVEYTVPEKARPNILIKYLNNVKEEGVDTAIAIAMHDLLGPEAMKALEESEAVTDDHMFDIMNVVEDILMKSMEKQAGKSRAARRR